MKKATNTSLKEVFPSWLLGGNPNAIEAQEARGQQELIESLQLPRKCNSPRGINAAEQYHKMGIKVFTTSKDDDIFMGVKMPTGWKKVATDHSMWNNLVDDKGRIRATIFYKAAFYDRDSFINFETRYQTGCDYFNDEKNPEKDWDQARIAYVKDANIGEKIWTSEKHFSDGQDKAYQDGKNWLNENYPDWENINAYWD